MFKINTMLKDGFHKGRLSRICDPEELEDIEPSVMIAKM